MAEPTNTPMPPATPIPASTPRSASPVPPVPSGVLTNGLAHRFAKPIVLHIGDPIKYNPETYAAFSDMFQVVRPEIEERRRPEFVRAMREGRWGQFSAVFRPFWGTGGEMGKWDDELIELLPESCRVFASAGAGFDWADTKALGEKGIIYCNSGLAAAEAVADFTVAMIISTFRHLPWCMGAATELGSSPKESALLFNSCHALATGSSHNLRKHTLGLIGLGNIGQQLAEKLGCPAFGMRIHYYDVVRKSPEIEEKLGAIYHDTLAELLRVSDCVVLCAPAATHGKPLMTKEVLSDMKSGSRFVNIARGSLVDDEALADALEEGRIATAALDVHSTEPKINARLLKLASPSPSPRGHPGRVMLTCHNAGGTVETHAGFEELSMRNIMAVLRGQDPITPVNLQYLKKHE